MKKGQAFVLFCLILSSSSFASWVDAYKKWTHLAVGQMLISMDTEPVEIPYAPTLANLRMNYGAAGLKQLHAYLSNEEIEVNNKNLFNLIKQEINYDIINGLNGYSPLEDSVTTLTENQVRSLYQNMTSAKVVMEQRNYGGMGVGFCFGRALVAHNLALFRKIHPASIRKIWVVGNMGFWGHHVATIVKTKKSWMAIDNFTGVMTVEDWMERMKYERDGEAQKPLMFFITRAARFGHSTNYLYNSTDLFNVTEENILNFESEEGQKELKSNDFYQGFFMDFYKELDENPYTLSLFSEETTIEEHRVQEIYEQEEQWLSEQELLSDQSSYELSAETIYCYNDKNQKVNCNYQLDHGPFHLETSVSITGFAQYIEQVQDYETIYAKHIINKEVEGEKSYHISIDENGTYKKVYVRYFEPVNKSKRPLFIVESESQESQEELQKQVYELKEVLSKFNPKYKVKNQETYFNSK